jgi:hypothetical protein
MILSLSSRVQLNITAGPFHAAGSLALGDVRTQIPETNDETAAKLLWSLGLRLGHLQTTGFFAHGGKARNLDTL